MTYIMDFQSDLNPPEPGSMGFPLIDSSASTTLSLVRQFTSLFRPIEKSVKQNLDVSQDELTQAIRLLGAMRDLFRRQGLLQGDTSKLEALCCRQPSGSTVSNLSDDLKQPTSGKNKRKRRQGASAVQYQVQLSTASELNVGESDGALLNASSSCDEILIMTSISRILNPSTTMAKDSCEYSFPLVLTRAAVDVIAAICYGLKDSQNQIDSSDNPCHIVECQILESFSSTILNGLVKAVKSLTAQVPDLEDDDVLSLHISTLSSCCTCFMLIIVAMGTKLSRSTHIMTQIKALVNDLLWMDQLYSYSASVSFGSNSHRLVDSICGLVSVIPITGDSNSTPSNKIWTRLVYSVATAYRILLDKFSPETLRKQQSTAAAAAAAAAATIKLNQKSPISFEDEIVEWVALIPSKIPSQQQRLRAFRHRAHVYSCLLTKLLSLEHYDSRAMTHLSTASLPIIQLLDLCDLLLGFSSNAERRYLNTKVRLRDVTVENGFFSVKAAVSVGNVVKFIGCDLFQTVVSILNRSCLIYGKRLLQTCLLSLKSSTSFNVRKIVDPTYSEAILSLGKTDKNGKRKWLHNSILLRTKAVQAVTIVVEQIGSTIVFEINSFTLLNNIIAGCLLEQILVHEKVEDQDHWGTLSDRVDLVASCLDAISCITSVCGGFISSTIRETIESIAISCITHLRQYQNSHPLLSFASTKAATLRLALNCVSSPWSDGCASSLIGLLHAAASHMRYDRDEVVSCMAHTALAVCNTLMVPRAPPLVLGIRNISSDGDPKSRGIDSSIATVSYESLISGIMIESTKEFTMTYDTEMLANIDDRRPLNDRMFSSQEAIDTETDVSPKIVDETVQSKLGSAGSSVAMPNAHTDHVAKIGNCVDEALVPSSNHDFGTYDKPHGSMHKTLIGHSTMKKLEKDSGELTTLNEYKFKSDKMDAADSRWTRPKEPEKSGSFDDDEGLPDIIDGEPDEDM